MPDPLSHVGPRGRLHIAMGAILDHDRRWTLEEDAAVAIGMKATGDTVPAAEIIESLRVIRTDRGLSPTVPEEGTGGWLLTPGPREDLHVAFAVILSDPRCWELKENQSIYPGLMELRGRRNYVFLLAEFRSLREENADA